MRAGVTAPLYNARGLAPRITSAIHFATSCETMSRHEASRTPTRFTSFATPLIFAGPSSRTGASSLVSECIEKKMA